MRKTKYLLLLLIVTLSLASCQLFPQSEEKDSTIIWSENIETYIITNENTQFIQPLCNHLNNLTGKTPSILDPSMMDKAHEIIVGEVDRSISATAYSKFRNYVDLTELNSNRQSAYLIYAEGGSLALAYNDLYSRDAAIQYITENLTKESYDATGVIKSSTFYIRDFVNEQREKQREAGLEALVEEYGRETVDALKTIYKLYDENLYLWAANLYDSGTGGFYYSNSARDNDGFLPDIESTAQILNMLETSGLTTNYGGNWTKYLPSDMNAELLAFAKSLQSADDGYFYHPQWGTSISTTRRGRDLGNATSIITALGQKPTYDAPNNVKGENALPASYMTGQLSASAAQMVSKVIAVAALPSELASEEAFIKYLEGLKITEDSYSRGNLLNSRAGEIKGAGLTEVMRDYLVSIQYKHNGLWEEEITYNSINGLMKISSLFGTSYKFPNPETAMESVMQIITLDVSDEIEGITFVYNPWVCIYNLLGAFDDEQKTEFRSSIKNRYAELILKTYQKLAVFEKNDGGCSYLPDYSSEKSQGALVAVKNTRESDVNASAISVSTVVKYMFSCLNIDAPELYYYHDGEYFLRELGELSPVIKVIPVVVPEVETFDDYDAEEGETEAGVVTYPADSIVNTVGKKDIVDGKYKWFESSVVQNPDPNSKIGDLVLYSKVYTYPDEEEAVASTASRTDFKIVNSADAGNCFVFDGDIYFAGGGTGVVAQIFFTQLGTTKNSASFNIEHYEYMGKNYLKISENYAGLDGFKDPYIVTELPVAEWFNLKIELYKDEDESTGLISMKLKVFIDGKFAGASDSGLLNADKTGNIDYRIDSVRFSYYRHVSSEFYLNNIYTEKTIKTYFDEAVTSDRVQEVVNEKEILDFEYGIGATDSYGIIMSYKDPVSGEIAYIDPGEWTAAMESQMGIGKKAPGIKFYQSASPTDAANKVLKIYTWNTNKTTAYNSTLTLESSYLAEGGTTYEFTMDYYFDTFPWLYAEKYFSIEFRNDYGTKLYGLNFAASDIPEGNKIWDEIEIRHDDGTAIDGIKLYSGNWYTLKFSYYYNEENFKDSRMKIFVMDEDESFACIADFSAYFKPGEVTQIGLEFSSYNIRGEQYMDNISFATTDEKYVEEEIFDIGDVTGIEPVIIEEQE